MDSPTSNANPDRSHTPTQEIEYILQESTCEPRSSIGDTASAKKARASSPASGGGEVSSGGTSPTNLRSTGGRSPKPFATAKPSPNPYATWSPGGLGGRGNSTATTADDDDDPFSEQLFTGGGSKPARSGSERHGESVRDEWRTIRRTRRARESVELPHASSSPSTSRDGGAVPVALRYRVGVRRKGGPLKVVFR